MRVLFDHGTPAPLIPFLAGHAVTKAKDRGWDTLSNGDLLTVAEEAGFDLPLTTVKLHVDKVAAAVTAAMPGSYVEVELPERA
jgi:hypothetical protein